MAIKISKGSHKMPDGTIMKDSAHSKPKMQKGGSKVKSGPDYRHMPLVHWTDDYNTKKDSTDYKKGYTQGVSNINQGKPKSKTLYNPQFGVIPERLGYSEAYERNKEVTKNKIKVKTNAVKVEANKKKVIANAAKYKKGGSTPAWTRSEGKNPTGGLNAKGVASYRAANPGSKLKMAVTTKPSKIKAGSKDAKRRASFCARMSGMPGPAKKPNGEPTRKTLALRKWNC